MKQRRASFDQVAKLYDAYRPGYPDELVQFVITASRLPPAGRILEIGCGTGIATRKFASLGYSLIADLIEIHGGLIERPCVAHAFVAQRREDYQD